MVKLSLTLTLLCASLSLLACGGSGQSVTNAQVNQKSIEQAFAAIAPLYQTQPSRQQVVEALKQQGKAIAYYRVIADNGVVICQVQSSQAVCNYRTLPSGSAAVAVAANLSAARADIERQIPQLRARDRAAQQLDKGPRVN